MNILMRCRFGSHLYGLSTPESDLDFKTVYMPTLQELLLNTYNPVISISPKGQNKAGDVDEEYIALPRFIQLACENRPIAIEMLHAEGENLLQTSPIWTDLQSRRKSFYSKNVENLVTFARAQAERYDIKGATYVRLGKLKEILESHPRKTRLWRLQESNSLPVDDLCHYEERNEGQGSNDGLFYIIGDKAFNCKTMIQDVLPSVNSMIKKYGERVKAMVDPNSEVVVDWQSVCYALRGAYQAIDILKEGDFEFPLKQTAQLLDIKLGKLNYDDIKGLLIEVTETLPALRAKSTLPDQIVYEDWYPRLLQYYFNYFPEFQNGA